jgi:hypothetical protein
MIFFLNAQGKVYARYGGRDHTSPTSHHTAESLRKAMQAALARHEQEKRNPSPRPAWTRRTPEDIPPLGRALRSEQFCVRCHMVYDYTYKARREAGTWTRDLVWRYPPPDNLGLVMDVDEGNLVKRVTAGSFADKAGVKPGDVLRTAGSTEVLTYTDLQWVLDKTPAVGRLPLVLERGRQRAEAVLELSGDWRRSDLSWRKSFLSIEPQAGVWVHEVEDERRPKLGLPATGMALEIFYVDPDGPARKAGLKSRDIVVSVDGRTTPMGRHEFRTYWPTAHDRGQTGTMGIVRDGKPMTVTLQF